MPSQECFRCEDTGDFCQEFPAERLTLYREPTSLVVNDSGLLLALDPTSDGDDQQCLRLDRRAHDPGF